MAGLLESPSRTLLEETQPPRTPLTRPMTPAPFMNPYWIQVDELGWASLGEPQVGLGQVREELGRVYTLFWLIDGDLSKTGLKP